MELSGGGGENAGLTHCRGNLESGRNECWENGGQCLVSRNQIDISTDLIGIAVVKIASYPKATNEEFTSTTVVCDGISVAQINQEARYLVGFL